jgi:hypothetical protein
MRPVGLLMPIAFLVTFLAGCSPVTIDERSVYKASPSASGPRPVEAMSLNGDFGLGPKTTLDHGLAGEILIFGAGRDEPLNVKLSRSLNRQLEGRGLKLRYVEIAAARHSAMPEQPEFAPAVAAFFARIAAARAQVSTKLPPT